MRTITELLASPPLRSLTVQRTTYSPSSVQLFDAEGWLRLLSTTERSPKSQPYPTESPSVSYALAEKEIVSPTLALVADAFSARLGALFVGTPILMTMSR